jgi:hypothetical protein
MWPPTNFNDQTFAELLCNAILDNPAAAHRAVHGFVMTAIRRGATLEELFEPASVAAISRRIGAPPPGVPLASLKRAFQRHVRARRALSASGKHPNSRTGTCNERTGLAQPTHREPPAGAPGAAGGRGGN